MTSAICRSASFFTKFRRPSVRYLRCNVGNRVLAYIDDFMVTPFSPSRESTMRDVLNAQSSIGRIMDRMGMRCKAGKGC